MVIKIFVFLLILAAFCEEIDKETVAKGREIFKTLRENPNGKITKAQMKEMLVTLFDSIFIYKSI